MEVRRALEGDRETWLALRRAFAPGLDIVEHQAQIDHALANRMQRAVFVCFEEAERAVGMLEVVIRPYYPGIPLAPVAALESFWVPSTSAGESAARALIIAAESWARTRGCRELALNVPADDAEVIARRIGLGFVEIGRPVLLRRPIAMSVPTQPSRSEQHSESAVPRRPATPRAWMRSHAWKLVHGMVVIAGMVSIASSDISSPDPLRGAWLPLIGAVCVIYGLAILAAWRYRSRTSESERGRDLFSPPDEPNRSG